ncbi:MAG: carboxyl-terminal processing protease [Verrucomicrobiota bacterium]
MRERFVLRLLLLLLSAQLALPLRAAEPVERADKSTAAEALEKPIQVVPVTPGRTDGRIACVTANLLEQAHYSRQPFDRAVSSKFLDRYLETLDPQHLHFLQSDLAEFEPYRTNLGDMTITPRGEADTRPACKMFNRFMERLQQRVAYVDELLKKEKFDFNTDERITVNRHEVPYPKDMSEAKKLWRERLRFEYLQEHLGKIEAKKKADLAASKPQRNPEKDSTPKVSKKDARPKSEAQEITEVLAHRYHRNLRAFAEWNNEDVLQIYLTTLAHVYDPHSDYFGRPQLESFAIGMNLSLFGIGAELVAEDGYCTIRRLLPNGPAEKSKKIKVKDRIVAVAQADQPPIDVVEMSLTKAVQLIRGPKGTQVRLTIIPEGADPSATTVVTLVRDEIKLEDSEAKAKVIELPSGHGDNLRLGVIDLPSFYAQFDVGGPRHQEIANTRASGASKSTTADVARLINKLKHEHVGGIILDLRRNGGGSLEEAIKLTGLFIREGPIVQVRDSKGVQAEDDPDPSVLYDGPLIVLTSRFSASASEILAGALQDYGRALLVGDASTHGKGTVQSVNPLRPYMQMPDNVLTNDPGALKLTIKKFYRASGASTQLKGVVPDIVLPSVFNESKDIGESALDNPLPWDTIPSAKYKHLDMVDPYLPELRKRSSQRVSNEKEFEYVREDIEQFKKIQADKTVSLNEKQRLKEKDEAEARQKAREQERLARKEPPEKVYELTLRQTELPLVEKTNAAMAKLSNPRRLNDSGTSTNSASVTPRPSLGEGDAEDDLADDKTPPPDVDLVEAEHILVDYLAVMSKDHVLTAGH